MQVRIRFSTESNERRSYLIICIIFTEAMFVDTTGDAVGGRAGDIYIITKFPSARHLQRLAKLPASVHEKVNYGGSIKSYSLQYKGRLFREDNLFPGAEMSMDGTLIAVRSYAGVYFFPRDNKSPSAKSLSNVLGSSPCKTYHDSNRGVKLDGQYETVDVMNLDGNMYVYEASECWNQNACKVNVTMTELKF